ncbi:MAG: porin family protein [Candidatus Schekmanbacteria bacterium]|nr:porin family protein [Candidatus Schekmanbacteria bacterium]
MIKRLVCPAGLCRQSTLALCQGLVLLVLVAASTSAPRGAEPRAYQPLEGRFGIGLQPGFWWPRESSAGKSFGGISASWRGWPAVSIDGDLDYTGQRANTVGHRGDEPSLLDYDTKLLAAQASASYHLRALRRVDPVAFAGLGYYYFDISGTAEAEDGAAAPVSGKIGELGVHGGLGVLFRVREHSVFNVRAKYLSVRMRDRIDGVEIDDNRWRGLQLSLGFSYYF